MSEPQRPRPSELRSARLRRPLSPPTRLRFARGYAPSLWRHAPGCSLRYALRPRWAGDSETPSACCRTPPAPRLWGSLPRLCILFHMGIPPRVLRRKKGGVAASLRGCQNVRQSNRPSQSEASSYPTLWPHPARASRRSEHPPCGRPLPARPRHRAAWKESP